MQRDSSLLKRIASKEKEAEAQVRTLQGIKKNLLDAGITNSEINTQIHEALLSLSFPQMKMCILKAKIGVVGEKWYKDM